MWTSPTSSPRHDIAAEHWVVLDDPKNLVPGQHIVPLIADRKADSTVRKALARLGNVLTTQDLTELNRLWTRTRRTPRRRAVTGGRHGLSRD